MGVTKSSLWSSVALAAALLSACAPALPTDALRPESVSAEARIALTEANPVAAYGLLVASPPNRLTPNDASTLARIEVWMSRGGAAAVLLGDLAGTARLVKLNALRLDTEYRVQLKGFKANPNQADPGFTMQISADDASSASFRTDPDASGAYAALRNFSVPLVLTNQVFSGQAEGGVVLTEGTLSSTAEPEALATGGL